MRNAVVHHRSWIGRASLGALPLLALCACGGVDSVVMEDMEPAGDEQIVEVTGSLEAGSDAVQGDGEFIVQKAREVTFVNPKVDGYRIRKSSYTDFNFCVLRGYTQIGSRSSYDVIPGNNVIANYDQFLGGWYFAADAIPPIEDVRVWRALTCQ